MPTCRSAENPYLTRVNAVVPGIVTNETNSPVYVFPDFRDCVFGLAPVNHSEQRVSPLDESLPIQTLGHPVYFILRAEPSAADDKHDSAIIALGQGLKNVERQGQAVLPPVNDFLLPLKKALVCKSNRRAGKNEDDNQQWKRTIHRQAQLILHARKQLQVCTKMQRTKKGPATNRRSRHWTGRN